MDGRMNAAPIWMNQGTNKWMVEIYEWMKEEMSECTHAWTTDCMIGFFFWQDRMLIAKRLSKDIVEHNAKFDALEEKAISLSDGKVHRFKN